MLKKLRGMFGRNKPTTTVTHVTNNSTTVVAPTAKASGPKYRVVMPGLDTVVVRQPNQTEARKFVRDSLGVKRLPDGTKITKVD